jgi:hypothetical protein
MSYHSLSPCVIGVASFFKILFYCFRYSILFQDRLHLSEAGQELLHNPMTFELLQWVASWFQGPGGPNSIRVHNRQRRLFAYFSGSRLIWGSSICLLVRFFNIG